MLWEHEVAGSNPAAPTVDPETRDRVERATGAPPIDWTPVTHSGFTGNERWLAHQQPREDGRLAYEERLRAQRWLTYERNEAILGSCLRIAEEMARRKLVERNQRIL